MKKDGAADRISHHFAQVGMDESWIQFRAFLQRDMYEVFKHFFEMLESDQLVVPLLGLVPHLSDADFGRRLEEESSEAACILGCVQAFYVYGEAREHYSQLRTLLLTLLQAQTECKWLAEDADF